MNNVIDLAKVQIEASWKEALLDEFKKPYFSQIKSRLLADRHAGKTIYPAGDKIFNAFNSTAFQAVKVIIIGQDPYHQPNQAMGLSFSVPKNVRIPPSLNNIFKELNRSIEGFSTPMHGDLSSWASQGVFLLNAVLTVEANQAGSHANIGWQNFTDSVIKTLSNERNHLVFMLWGNVAKRKAELIDEERHCILTAFHPSPLAGNRFHGCNHFAEANAYLISTDQAPINWQL